MASGALTHASLHHAILRSFVIRGHAPSHEELAASFGVDARAMTSALQELAAYHGVVLHPHAPEVWVAHPFSAAPTTFVVRHEERMWWGNCAWCSLGIAALLGGTGITIDTSLGAEGRPVAIRVENNRIEQDLVVHFPIPMARAWDNVIFTCSTMLVFDSERAVEEWAIRHALPRGDVQRIQKAYDFAREWYGRHLEPDWQKWTIDEARGLFEKHGLRGPIWELPRSGDRF